MPHTRDTPRFSYLPITEKNAIRLEIKIRREQRRNEPFYTANVAYDPYRPLMTHPAIIEAIPEIKGLRILDAGCGEGSLLRAIASEREGVYLYGINLTPLSLEKAANEEKSRPLGIRYVQGDMRYIPFPDEFFDAIVSHHSINEVVCPGPEKAFEEFFRILKPGGELALLFLNPNHEHEKRYLPPRHTVPIHHFRKELVVRQGLFLGRKRTPGSFSSVHLPRGEWDLLLFGAGFILLPSSEPHPSRLLLKRDRWLRNNFRTPRFIMLRARKP